MYYWTSDFIDLSHYLSLNQLIFGTKNTIIHFILRKKTELAITHYIDIGFHFSMHKQK